MKKRVGQILLDEIAKYNVDKIFGVPGDFNLAFLDDIISHEQLDWVGNTNELNGSYAADGYARIKGLGALVTTFGVGELSAVNGIAGSYAERVPVVAITGAPTTAVEKAGKYVHHSLGEGRFDEYQKMFSHITCAQTYLTAENALTEIPKIISACYTEKRPVHIHMPIDVAMTEIEVKDVAELEVTSVDCTPYAEMIESALKASKQPVIITGHEINSFHLHDALEQFVNKTHIPVAQLSLGKSAFNEENEHYIGIYDGEIADPEIKNYVDQSDCVINLGAKLTDSATAGFSYQFDLNDVIYVNHHDVKINDLTDNEVTLVEMMNALQSIEYTYNGSYPQFKADRNGAELTDEPLTQENYFKLMNKFLQKDDILLAEQGTSFFGAYDLSLYKDNTYIGQPLWGSIGYTLPSTLGTLMAAPERRNVLLIGDGSLQLTVQELSTIIRHELKPVIFVINNDGYTVERLIHGEKEAYNDIVMWDYKALPAVFGGKDSVKIHEANSTASLSQVMDTINADTDHMHFVEVRMSVMDAPEKLEKISKAFAKQNS